MVCARCPSAWTLEQGLDEKKLQKECHGVKKAVTGMALPQWSHLALKEFSGLFYFLTYRRDVT